MHTICGDQHYCEVDNLKQKLALIDRFQNINFSQTGGQSRLMVRLTFLFLKITNNVLTSQKIMLLNFTIN